MDHQLRMQYAMLITAARCTQVEPAGVTTSASISRTAARVLCTPTSARHHLENAQLITADHSLAPTAGVTHGATISETAAPTTQIHVLLVKPRQPRRQLV